MSSAMIEITTESWFFHRILIVFVLNFMVMLEPTLEQYVVNN